MKKDVKDLINIRHTDGSIKFKIKKETVDKDDEVIYLGKNPSNPRDKLRQRTKDDKN